MQQLTKQVLALPAEVTMSLQGHSRGEHIQNGASINEQQIDQDLDGSDEFCATRGPIPRVKQQGRGLSFKIPLRFRQQIWHFAAMRSMSGWMFGLHMYTVRTRKAPVFELLQAEDVLGMRKLFASGQGSPFDCNEDGDTLLEVRISTRAMQ